MVRDYIAEWFKIAEMDLTTAEYLQGMQPQPLEIICFLCQQSSEKRLKGYLVYKGIAEPAKTHNLTFLNDECSEYDDRFNMLDTACSVLTRYGVQPRYPQEIRITEKNMAQALEYARQIRNFEQLEEVRREVNKNSM